MATRRTTANPGIGLIRRAILWTIIASELIRDRALGIVVRAGHNRRDENLPARWLTRLVLVRYAPSCHSRLLERSELPRTSQVSCGKFGLCIPLVHGEFELIECPPQRVVAAAAAPRWRRSRTLPPGWPYSPPSAGSIVSYHLCARKLTWPRRHCLSCWRVRSMVRFS